MYKLGATILKDIRILTRDKLGLIFMFVMPIVLAIVITAVQNSTFEILNNNKVPLLLCNKDKGPVGAQLVKTIDKVGMFKLKQVTADQDQEQISKRMHAKDAIIAIIIPEDYSAKTEANCKSIAAKALKNFGMQIDSVKPFTDSVQPVSYTHLTLPTKRIV